MHYSSRRWIICLTGFMQTHGRPSGLVKIQDYLVDHCQAKGTRCLLKSWKDSPQEMANRIQICHYPGLPLPEVTLLSYSYGAYTALELADELLFRGFPVRAGVFVDPVWRWRQARPSLLSLAGWWKLYAPENIKTAWAFYQKNNKPSGHQIVATDKTILHETTLNRRHQTMDDAPEVWDLCLKVACPHLHGPELQLT